VDDDGVAAAEVMAEKSIDGDGDEGVGSIHLAARRGETWNEKWIQI